MCFAVVGEAHSRREYLETLFYRFKNIAEVIERRMTFMFWLLNLLQRSILMFIDTNADESKRQVQQVLMKLTQLQRLLVSKLVLVHGLPLLIEGCD